MERKNIYILTIIFTIVLSTTTVRIEIDHHEQKQSYSESYKDLDDYKEVDIFYPLEIKNFQNDNKVLKYEYKLIMKNLSGAYKYRLKDKEGYLVFTANGETTFKLNSNESIIIYDLPDSQEFEIEQLTNVSKNYTTKINDKEVTKYSSHISSNSVVEIDNETIKDETTPNSKVENPYTKDNYVLIVLIFMITCILITFMSNFKVRRFE